MCHRSSRYTEGVIGTLTREQSALSRAVLKSRVKTSAREEKGKMEDKRRKKR